MFILFQHHCLIPFIRLFQLSKQGKLTVPAMNVNDSVTKVSQFEECFFLHFKTMLYLVLICLNCEGDL